MSIITKFSIFIIIIFSTVSAAFFYFVFSYSEDNFRQQIFEDLVIVAELEEGYLLTFLESAKGRAIDFSSDGLIRDYTEKILTSKASFSGVVQSFNDHLINNKQSVDKTIKGIFVSDLDGKIIAATNADEVGKDESDDAYFRNIMGANLGYGSAYISDVFVSYHFGTPDPVFLVAAPIFSVDQKNKLGYIVIQISLDEINKILSGEKTEELGAISGVRGRRSTFDTYLINENNLLITASIYDNEGLLRQRINSSLTDACRSKRETIDTYSNFHGVRVLGASMCLPVHNWTLVTEISESEAFLIIDNLRKNALIFIIVFSIILVVLSVLFLYYLIIKNVLLLRSGVQVIGSGNLDHEIKIPSKDEFSDLAKDFNNMAMQLKKLFSDLKVSAMTIKESEEKYRMMFDGAADAVFVADVEGNFIEVNKNALSITGYSEKDLLKMNYLQIYMRDDMAKCQEQFRTALQKRFCFVENVNIAKKNGESVPVDISMSVFEYSGKQFLQLIMRDVSERIAIQRHHTEIDHIKSQFINVVSHQLRTPLNSVRWNLEVLLNGDLGKMKVEQVKFLKTIYLNNQNIINIISDLFLALEIEEGKVSLEKEIVNLDVIFKHISELMKNNISIKNLKLNIVKPQKPQILNIEADSDKLTQVFSRLVDNAVKYTKEGGEINVEFEQVNHDVVVRIADTGIGIPKKEQETIFSKFFRASNAAVMYPNASGLGLFISKKIIEAHGGKIWFESKEGKGTTFYISLPGSGF